MRVDRCKEEKENRREKLLLRTWSRQPQGEATYQRETVQWEGAVKMEEQERCLKMERLVTCRWEGRNGNAEEGAHRYLGHIYSSNNASNDMH